MTAADYAQVFRGQDGLFYFHVRAGNHEVIASSEGYVEKRSALATLAEHWPKVSIADLDAVEDDGA